MTDINYDYDFGFTAVDENELSVAQDAVKTKDELLNIEEALKAEQQKSETLYKMILPLLNNLRENPEKDYIFWPKRTKIIDDFEAKLTETYNGN
jgi:hypothetical protein